VTTMRLDCQDHALFEHDVAVARHDRLLLVPPASDAVSDQHRFVFPSVLAEFLHHKLKHIRRSDARLASFDGFIVDVTKNLIFALYLRARLAENCVAGQDNP